VWRRTPHFTDGLRLLLNLKWTDIAVNIAPNSNKEAVEAYNKAIEDRVTRRKHEMEVELKYDMETKKRLGVIVEDAGAEDDDIIASYRGHLFSKVKDFMNPMTLTVKPVLHPIQLKLRMVVIYLRIMKSIVMWDDFYYAFWLALASFAISLSLIWVPWGWAMRWLFRVVAWIGLGPWMMVVDQKYFAENPDLTPKEREELIRKKVEARYEAVIKAATDYQIRKERIVKLKSMSTYMFGRFHLRVPRFNEDLVTIAPLPDSYAKTYDPLKADPIRIVDRKYGQRLEGDMIPMRDIQIAKRKSVATKQKRSILPGKAGKMFGRFRKSTEPLKRRAMESIVQGEHFLAENLPVLGNGQDTSAVDPAQGALAVASGDTSKPKTSKVD
jgi:hypothetical protein